MSFFLEERSQSQRRLLCGQDAGHCPSGSSEGQAAGSGSGGDAAVPPSCLEAWQRVWIICVALFLGGWVLFVGLTLVEPRYRR